MITECAKNRLKPLYKTKVNLAPEITFTWPLRMAKFGPKPSLFLFVLFFFLLPVFPPCKGILLFTFECFPLFLLSLFGVPPFAVSLSLSLSLYVSISLVFFCFFFLFFGGSSFLSFLFFCFLCFCFEQHQNVQLQSFFSAILSLCFGFLSCFLIAIPFSYLCFT